jgi:nitroimidazol reductase NimA-like FMN-containing flavoprotein (pyridoxamine 5'-phosphate oxidase superfamily)
MKKMRRVDRSISQEEAVETLKSGEYGVLSTVDGEGQPYGIPVSFVLWNGAVYFHASNEGGSKYDNIEKNPKVSFTVVGNTKVLPEQFGTLYMSAIAFGRAHLVEDEEERLSVFKEFLNKYSAGYFGEGMKYIEEQGHDAMVVKIEIDSITGKGRKAI